MKTDRAEVSPRAQRRVLAIGQIVPDAQNRPIDETDETFELLKDSIRVLGVLQPVHVRSQPDGTFLLIDGERRWRAARANELAELPCEVWPDGVDPQTALVAGVVLNDQRKAHSSIHIARRLHEIKTATGATNEQLSAQVGIPLDRVKTYSALVSASELLQAFFEKHDVPLKVAAEMMRFEKSTDEKKTGRLIERYRREPLSREDVAALRRRATGRSAKSPASIETEAKPIVTDRFRAAFNRDPAAAVAELQDLLAPFGYLIVQDVSPTADASERP